MTTEAYRETRSNGKPNLPPALAPLIALDNWVVWRYEPKGKNGKLTKVPYQVRSPKKPAASNKPATWASYAEAVAIAVAVANRFDGVGFMLPGSGIAAFDLDDCRDPTSGIIHPWAQGLIERAASYVEITPSGKGLRIIGLGTGEEVHKKIPVSDGVSCEVYRNATRYITMTGHQLGDTAALANIDATIDAVVAELNVTKPKINGSFKSTTTIEIDDVEVADEDVPEDELVDLIKNGCGDNYEGDRSRAVWRVIHGMLRRGNPPEVVLKIILDKENKISEHIYDKPNPEDYARKQVENARAKAPWTIIARASNYAAAVDETQEAIVAKGRPVFSRANMLVEPIWGEYPASKGRKTKITHFRPLNVSNLSYLITKHVARYLKYNFKTKKTEPIPPPKEMLEQLLTVSHGWAWSNRASGIINCPTLRPDGSILARPGYDKATQLWASWDSDLVLPPILETEDAAREALKLYSDLLVGFPFIAELDKSVAIAGILTTVLRGAFDLAPMFLVLAAMAGTGKSHLVDTISNIATGRYCPVITTGRREEEFDKRLGSMLLEGLSLFSIDNLSHDLQGDQLNQMLTQRIVKIRILQKSKMPETEWRGTLFATGNNVRLVGELIRRGLICNLDAKDERPEMRPFDFDPIDLVLGDRGKYIAAALTIARAYRERCGNVSCSPIASYGEWSATVREPLIWLGLDDPIDSQEQGRKEDPKRNAAREFIANWIEHLGTTEDYKVAEIIAKAREKKSRQEWIAGEPNWEYVRPEFFNALVERAGIKNDLDPTRLGHWLKELCNQVHSVGDHRFRIIRSAGGTHGVWWKLEKMG